MPPPVDEQPVGNRLNPEPEAPQAPEPGPAGPPQGQANPSSKPRLQPAPGPEPREAMDPICLTSEMEPISEEVQKKRKVDATLVRFSAVHDEMVREERERRSRRARLMPWLNKDNDLDDALTEMGNSGPAPARATVNTAEHQSLADDDLESVPDDDQPPEKSGRSGRRLGKGASGGPPRKPPGGTGKNPAARRPPRKRNSKAVLGAKIGATGAAVLILVLTFMGWHARAQVENTPVAQVAALDENSSYIQDAQRQMGDENFLIVGTSTDNGVATPAVSTVMVAHIPTDRSQAVVVSFPTDLAVDRPACTRWNNQASATTAEQVAPQNDVALGAVYQVGGPKCLTEAVQSVSGLRINHFVGIDAAGFSSLVSQASGIPLCVKAPISDSVLGNVVGQTGQVTLSGQQALNFVQASHVTGDTLANHGQIHRQQVLMAAALRQAVSGQGLLLSTSKLNDFLATFTKSSFGQNMGVDDLITLAQSLQATDLGKVNFVTLPTTGTLDAAGAETPVTSDDNQLFGELINNSPLPGASGGTATTAGSNSVVDPKTIKIQVLNAGNTTDNIAKDTAAKLAGQGFQILTKGTDSPVAKTVIRYSADEQAAARTLSSSVPGATLQVDPSLNGAIILDIGPGFDGKVQAPSATGGSTATTGSGTAPQLSTVNAKDTGCA
jgi:LCP family protein required for cell wall assembly